MADFAAALLDWFDQHGRHGLPWQQPRTPYRVWVSEIMLQQTQVATAIPYFERFMQRFPDVAALAAASTDEVLAHWSGLGYYARARNLHRAAQQLVAVHGGELPRTLDGLLALPGIGRSTAGAILAQAWGLRFAILDGNVRRVLARHAAVAGHPGLPAVQKTLWAEAEARLPQTRLADYTQAIMDLGSSLCSPRQPACARCPVAPDCAAHSQGRVAEFPSPRPRRARGAQQAQLLLIQDPQQRLLLERRPPSGIWGGLWCAPLVSTGQDWRQTCAERGLEVSSSHKLAPVQHAFTHFDLRLEPLCVQARPGAALQDSDAAWLTIPQALALGLPAPLRRLLQTPTLALETPVCPAPSAA